MKNLITILIICGIVLSLPVISSCENEKEIAKKEAVKRYRDTMQFYEDKPVIKEMFTEYIIKMLAHSRIFYNASNPIDGINGYSISQESDNTYFITGGFMAQDRTRGGYEEIKANGTRQISYGRRYLKYNAKCSKEGKDNFKFHSLKVELNGYNVLK
jgi:hypothetical protein